MSHGDPDHPEKNPRPVHRYEIIATAEAPGPWDSVKGYLTYDVVNQECTPENKFLGVHVLPRDVGLDVEMTRVDEKTWKGYFYRDYLKDDNYHGLGTCRWDVTSVAGVFVVHGKVFGPGSVFQDFLQNGPQTEYFRKSEYEDRSRVGRTLSTTPDDPEVIQHPEAYFPMTVAIKEVSP